MIVTQTKLLPTLPPLPSEDELDKAFHRLKVSLIKVRSRLREVAHG
jgi:hypothetical protein